MLGSRLPFFFASSLCAVLFNAPWARAQVTVDEWMCANAEGVATCSIKLRGVVAQQDYLYIKNVSDIDITESRGVVLGNTGVIGAELDDAFIYYSQFVPRVYSLAPIRGVTNPLVSLRARAIFSDTVGLSRENSVVDIVDLKQAFWHLVRDLWWPVFMFLFPFSLIVAHLGRGVGFRDLLSPAIPEWAVSIGMWSSVLFCMSMSRIPRVMIPSVLRPDAYYHLHGLFLVGVTMSLGEVALSVMSQKEGRAHFWNRAIAALMGGALLFNMFAKVVASTKAIHTFVFVTQNVTLLALWLAVSAQGWSQLVQIRGLVGLKGLRIVTLLLPGVLVRDSVVYWGYHSSGTAYWIHYLSLAFMVSVVIRNVEYGKIAKAGMKLNRLVRSKLQGSISGSERISNLCEWLCSAFSFTRATVIEVRNNEALLLGSEGSLRLKKGGRAKAHLSRLGRMIVESGRPMFFMSPAELPIDLRNDFHNAMAAVPVIEAGQVIGVLFLMAEEGTALSPKTVNLINFTVGTLQLEILSAVSEFREQRRAESLRNVLSVTSGVITEYLDDVGRFIGEGVVSKRVIVSADIGKSTRAAQMARWDKHLRELYDEALDEVYERWMVERDRVGFKSKDPRGDDFWALSEAISDSPSGVFERGLSLAFAIETVARQVFTSARFLCLGIPGARVIVTVGEVRMRVRGHSASSSIDTHSEQMSFCAKLRYSFTGSPPV